MESLGYLPKIQTYNWLLLACAKVADLKTAFIIWAKLLNKYIFDLYGN